VKKPWSFIPMGPTGERSYPWKRESLHRPACGKVGVWGGGGEGELSF